MTSSSDHKRRMDSLKVTIRIGRHGVSEALMKEIADQFSNKDMLKLKMNKGLIGASSRRDFWESLAKEAGARLIDQKGNVAVFLKH